MDAGFGMRMEGYQLRLYVVGLDAILPLRCADEDEGVSYRWIGSAGHTGYLAAGDWIGLGKLFSYSLRCLPDDWRNWRYHVDLLVPTRAG